MSKLSTIRVGTILDAVQDGAYRESAAKAAGISESTLYRWLERGEAVADSIDKGDVKVADVSKQDLAARELWEGLQKAEATAEVAAVRVVKRAAEEGNWTAAMTYLERKHPARWGRRLAVRDETPQKPTEINRRDVAEMEDALREAFGGVLPEGIDPGEILTTLGDEGGE